MLPFFYFVEHKCLYCHAKCVVALQAMHTPFLISRHWEQAGPRGENEAQQLAKQVGEDCQGTCLLVRPNQ